MKKILLIIGALLVVFSLNAQTTVSGYVYNDANGNGKKERREKGIPEVAVSNGVEVVLTDRKGYYELPVSDDNPVFVIKPSGFKVPVNENNLPQHYFLHKPNGSPQLKYPGVEPTGKLPKSVDFALVAGNESENFKALIFGDPQVRNKDEVKYFNKDIIAEVEGVEGVTFGLSLGDLMFNHLELFDDYIQATKKVGVPWYNVLGNHDINFDAKEDELSDETFERYFGPANYSYNYGKVHFIILDDVLYPNPGKGGRYAGGLRKDQLEFIKNDLQFVPQDYLVVLAFHIPLGAIRDEDRQELFYLLKDFPHTLSLSAHTHMQYQQFFSSNDGWKQENSHHHYNVGTTSGSWYGGRIMENGVPITTMRDGTPNGYAFITFTGNQYVVDYKAAGYPEDHRINIFAPKVVAHNQKTSAGIYANFFMGREGDQIMYRVDDGKWSKMRYQNDYDPSYLHLLHEWDFSEKLIPGRRLPDPRPSTHLWRGGIPTNLEPGEHVIEVKTTDMFGREFFGRKTYRIEKPGPAQ